MIIKSQTNSTNTYLPGPGASECQAGKNLNSNYFFNGTNKPQQQQQSQPNLPPPPLSTHNNSNGSQSNHMNNHTINNTNNQNQNHNNNNINCQSRYHQIGEKKSNDVSYLSSYPVGQMDGQKSANNSNNHTLGSKNHYNNNNNHTTTTTTTASVPNMLLVRPANPSSLHIGTFPFLPVQFF